MIGIHQRLLVDNFINDKLKFSLQKIEINRSYADFIIKTQESVYISIRCAGESQVQNLSLLN